MAVCLTGTPAAMLIDTWLQAARVLELPSAGLAYLLNHFCGVVADKRFQLAGTGQPQLDAGPCNLHV